MSKLFMFEDWRVYPVYGKYAENDRLAICLRDADDHCPVATATVNIPDVDLADDEVIIKDYSENRGIFHALYNANLISWPIRHVKAGYHTVPVCKFLGDTDE